MQYEFNEDVVHETEGRLKGPKYLAGHRYKLDADQGERWVRRGLATAVGKVNPETFAEPPVEVRFVRDEIYETIGPGEGPEYKAGKRYVLPQSQAQRWIRREAAVLADAPDPEPKPQHQARPSKPQRPVAKAKAEPVKPPAATAPASPPMAPKVEATTAPAEPPKAAEPAPPAEPRAASSAPAEPERPKGL